MKEKYSELILKGEVQDAIEFVKTNAPDIYIYKYSQGRRYELKSMFSEDGAKFWLSNLANFNDPFDGLNLSNCRSKKKYDANNPVEVQLAYKEQAEQYEANKKAEMNQNRLYATCFSENEPNTIKMWSYYADNHKGFCSRYSLKELLEAGVLLLPVVYTDKIQLDDMVPDYLWQLAIIKGKEWEWENEWRIVHIANEGEKAESGVLKPGILPNKIYCGCNDLEHVVDNHNYIKEIKKILGIMGSEWNGSIVFAEDNAKISLVDLEGYCKKHKVSLSSMAKSPEGYELFERKYLKY